MNKKITNGHTNISYQKDNLFIQEKVFNGFNHKINYQILEQFNFVPKLITENEKINTWEFIPGNTPIIDNQLLTMLANEIKVVHNSKLIFPPFNIARRIKEYRKILLEKNINIPIINNYYKRINYILKNQKKDTPIHGDIWEENLIQDYHGKIYLIDWEYAHMGDKHFELAYIIESLRLNNEQETIFLEAYDNYNYQFIKNHKELVNYLIILWNNSQPEKIFSDDEFIQKLINFEKGRKK